MSKKRIFGLAVMVVLALSVPAWAQDSQTQQPQSEQPQSEQPQSEQPQSSVQNQEGTLKLIITYNGSEGPVDQTHKLLVFVFDSPEIGQGAMPIKFDTLAENGGTLSMPFTMTPVYVAVVYDKPGNYDFSGPPASGCPATLYMTADSQGAAPIPIEPGKTTDIQLQFDDSIRVP